MEGKPVSRTLCSSSSSASSKTRTIMSEEVSSRWSHCIFCLKPTPPPPPPTKIESSLSLSSSVSTRRRRAVTLLERHLKLEQQHPTGPNQEEDYMNVCRSCASTLEAFCGLYEQIKELELRLEGEVDKLRSVVEHANRVPARGAWVKQCYQEKGHAGIMEEMYTWRRTFSRKCLKKLSSNFPKVMLQKGIHPNISLQQECESGLGIHKSPSNEGVDFQEMDIDIKYEVSTCSGSCSPVGNSGDVNNEDEEYEDASYVPDDDSPSDSSSRSDHDHDDEDYILPHDENPPIKNPTEPTTVVRRYIRKQNAPPASNRWCSLCSKLFQTNYHFNRHFKSNHDLKGAGLTQGQSAKCSECPAYFLTTFQLVRHLTHAHQQWKAISKPGPPSKRGLTAAEVKSGAGNKRFYCTGCPRWFFAYNSRSRHFSKNHVLEEDVKNGAGAAKKCDKPGCSAFFRTLTQLKNHKLQFHEEGALLKEPVSGKPCICTQCGDAFENKYRLKLHHQVKHKK